MFRKILFPTDFSDVSNKALGHLEELRGRGAETVVVLHVVDQRGVAAIEQYAPENFMELESNILKEAEAELARTGETLKNAGFKVKTRIETGVPVREILRVEKEEEASLLVIGSHGKSNLEEIFLGSVSEKVARKCKSPVLIVKR